MTKHFHLDPEDMPQAAATPLPEERTARSMARWIAEQGLTLIDDTITVWSGGRLQRYSQAVAGRPDLMRLVVVNVRASGHWSVETSPHHNELRQRPRRPVQMDMFMLVS